MKQVLQHLDSGKTELVDVPIPTPNSNEVLVRTTRSLISLGTERMLSNFGKSHLLGKAMQQPEKVRQTIQKVATDGVFSTVEAVRSKLSEPIPLGYCNVGIVEAVGDKVDEFSVGDRIISNAPHAEYAVVPRNLTARVPHNVDDDQASFTVLGSIALQGLRLVKPTLGETIAVFGLGLIGQLTVKLLIANGCRVIGLDFDAAKLTLAKASGAHVIDLTHTDDLASQVSSFTRGIGVDATIITTATDSNDPVDQSAEICRQRGRIVLVGTSGTTISRDKFYRKELSFQVSCSYGPGRYDPNYEIAGNDYPVGFVRWTERRNFEAFLDMLASGHITTHDLISQKAHINDAEQIYDKAFKDPTKLGVVFEYPVKDSEAPVSNSKMPAQVDDEVAASPAGANAASVDFIGAGNHAFRQLMPAFSKANADLSIVVSQKGASGLRAARKFGFRHNVSFGQYDFVNGAAPNIVIASRHDTHFDYVSSALEHGRNVFVEKPLCLTTSELDALQKQYQQLQTSHPDGAPVLMVGFNRRFAPHVSKAKGLLNKIPAAKSIVMTINAGHIPTDHWTQNPEVGGGRLIGECCHFIDLACFLAGVPVVSFTKDCMKSAANDTFTVGLHFADGSIATIHYFANGHKAVQKEKIDIFVDGRVLQIHNFRSMQGHGWHNFRKLNLWKQNKGQTECVKAFLESVSSQKSAAIPPEDIFESMRLTLMLAEI